jgi:hypothetical protein
MSARGLPPSSGKNGARAGREELEKSTSSLRYVAHERAPAASPHGGVRRYEGMVPGTRRRRGISHGAGALLLDNLGAL